MQFYVKLIQAALAAAVLLLAFVLNNDWLAEFQGLLAALLMIGAGILFILALWGDRLGAAPKS